MHTDKLLSRLDTPGSSPLWKVFWLQGVLLSHLLFGGILLFSAIGIFIGIFVTGMPLMNVWDSWAAPVLAESKAIMRS